MLSYDDDEIGEVPPEDREPHPTSYDVRPRFLSPRRVVVELRCPHAGCLCTAGIAVKLLTYPTL